MSKKHPCRPVFAQTATLTQSTKKKQPRKESDPCLTCKLPVSKCKGTCTKAEQKANGGKSNEQ